MPREYLSNIDTALLKLEHPTNLMMVTAAIILSDPVDFERMKLIIQKRLLRINRFRQRVIRWRNDIGRPHWKYDPDFDIQDHLILTKLPGSDSENLFVDLISQLASTPLDLQKPPWQFHFVENYGKGSALICRIHHCIADGIALVQVLLSLTDPSPIHAGLSYENEVLISPNDHNRHEYIQLLQDGLRSSKRIVNKAVSRSRKLITNPRVLKKAAKEGLDSASIVSEFLLLDPDPDTVLRGQLGINKRAAYSSAISLDDINIIRDRLGGTVNDVLMSVITGSLRSYLENHNEPVNDLNIHVTVPVNLRSPEDDGKLGNQLGAIFISLPVDFVQPQERLHLIRKRMNDGKNSTQGDVFFWLLNLLGMVSESQTNKLINILGNRATAVLTNVKGPSERLRLAGSSIETLLYWVPTTGRLGMGISILSYAGEVRLGVITDQGLVPDPETLIDGFHEDFEHLLAYAQRQEVKPSFTQKTEELISTLEKLDAIIQGFTE